MKTSIRKIGNSAGLIIPSSMLQKHGFDIGSEVELTDSPHSIEISHQKPNYTLSQLLNDCDLSETIPSELQDWDHADITGNELL